MSPYPLGRTLQAQLSNKMLHVLGEDERVCANKLKVLDDYQFFFLPKLSPKKDNARIMYLYFEFYKRGIPSFIDSEDEITSLMNDSKSNRWILWDTDNRSLVDNTGKTFLCEKV